MYIGGGDPPGRPAVKMFAKMGPGSEKGRRPGTTHRTKPTPTDRLFSFFLPWPPLSSML